MSNRDRPDRNKVPNRSTGDAANGAGADRSAPSSGWEFDPAEIDRYLSGGSSSRAGGSSRSTPGSRRPPTESSTAESLERLRRARAQHQQQRQQTSRAGQQPRQFSDPRFARPTRTSIPEDTVPADREPTAPRPRPAARPASGETPRGRDMAGAAPAGWDADPFGEDFLVDDESVGTGAATASRLPRLNRPSITLRRPANLPRPAVPAFVQRADVANDPTALTLIGLAVLSLAVMAILVANRIGNVVSPFATHINASGGLENFETNTAIWRLPLLSVAFFLMNLVAAWFIAPTDRFLGRFLLGVSIAVQLVAWVALIRFLW